MMTSVTSWLLHLSLAHCPYSPKHNAVFAMWVASFYLSTTHWWIRLDQPIINTFIELLPRLYEFGATCCCTLGGVLYNVSPCDILEAKIERGCVSPRCSTRGRGEWGGQWYWHQRCVLQGILLYLYSVAHDTQGFIINLSFRLRSKMPLYIPG